MLIVPLNQSSLLWLNIDISVFYFAFCSLQVIAKDRSILHHGEGCFDGYVQVWDKHVYLSKRISLNCSEQTDVREKVGT